MTTLETDWKRRGQVSFVLFCLESYATPDLLRRRCWLRHSEAYSKHRSISQLIVRMFVGCAHAKPEKLSTTDFSAIGCRVAHVVQLSTSYGMTSFEPPIEKLFAEA